MKVAQITIHLALPDGFVVDERTRIALDDLAAIMLVQAEDGLFTGGDPDGEDAEHVLDWGSYDNDGRTSFSSHVEVVDVDTEGSASRQHYIDTGAFLLAEETAPVLRFQVGDRVVVSSPGYEHGWKGTVTVAGPAGEVNGADDYYVHIDGKEAGRGISYSDYDLSPLRPKHCANCADGACQHLER